MEHEHDFFITTVDWTQIQRMATLRVCRTCGLTHRLAAMNDGSWLWKPVLVLAQEPVQKASEEHA